MFSRRAGGLHLTGKVQISDHGILDLRDCTLTEVKQFANFITIAPSAISNSNSNCVVGIVEDVEGVACVPGGDIIVQRSISR